MLDLSTVKAPINIIDRKTLIDWASLNEIELWDYIKKEIFCITETHNFQDWYEGAQQSEYQEKKRLQMKEEKAVEKVRFYKRRIKEMTDAKVLFKHYYGLMWIYETKTLYEMEEKQKNHELECDILEEKINQSMNFLDTTREDNLLVAHSDSLRSLKNLILKIDDQKVEFAYSESPIYTEKFLNDLSKIQDSHKITLDRYKILSEKNLEIQIKMYGIQNSIQNVQTKIQAWNLLKEGHKEEFEKLVYGLKKYMKDMVKPKFLKRNLNFEEVKQELDAFEPFKLKENVVQEMVWLRIIQKLGTDLKEYV